MPPSGVEFASVRYALPDGRLLLQDISFGCPAGTTTALLGRSGSGKTTLLRTVNGLVQPTGGKVLVDGREVQPAQLLPLRRGIGYVIQETGLFPHMTVERNLLMPLEVAGNTGKQANPREALSRVGLDEGVLHRYPWQLSGGQRQRVGVARALITEPKVLLMDEPFGALDPLTRAEMQAMLRPLLKANETTTLIVTHDLEEALFLADQVVLLEGGRMQAQAPADAVKRSTDPALAAYVRATHPREAAVA